MSAGMKLVAKCWMAVLVVFTLSGLANAVMFFELRETIPLPAGVEKIAAYRDMDGDGALDLVAGTSSQLKVYERSGAGWAERFSYTQSPLRALQVAQVDGDGYPEILTSNLTSVAIHEASGNNSYQLRHQETYGFAIEGEVRVGDTNDNGKQEFLIPKEGTPARLFVLEATGNNTYADVASYEGPSGGWNCRVAGAGRLDGDSRTDLVFSGYSYASGQQPFTYVFENGAPTLQTNAFRATHLGDTDGNGRLEILATPSDGTSDLLIYEHVSGDTYMEVCRAQDWWQGVTARGHAVADVDGDGQTELLRAVPGAAGVSNVLSVQNRNGEQLVDQWNSGTLLQGAAIDDILAVGDTNGDGSPEIALLQGHSLHILELSDAPPPEHVIDGVPNYLWNYGCTPTCGGMIAGYWDRQGFAALLPGAYGPLSSGEPGDPLRLPDDPLHPRDTSAGGYEATYGDPAVNDMIATVGHHRDYWAHGLDAVDPASAGVDPLLDGHNPDDSIADFMHTSRGALPNGSTWLIEPDMGQPNPGRNWQRGLCAWASAQGYDDPNEAGFTETSIATDIFQDIKDWIDADRPVLADWPGHTTVCYGYRDGAGDDDWLAIYDTWWDGNSNGMALDLDGDGLTDYTIEAMMQGSIEWWRFRTSPGPNDNWYVNHAATWRPLDGATSTHTLGTVFGDSFDRDVNPVGPPGGLGYAVDPGLGSGEAEIVSSPLGDGNNVLRFSQPDSGSFVAIERDFYLGDLFGVDFDYLFDTEGKIKVELDGFLLAELACPLFGPGSVGADSFGFFSQVFSMYAIGLDPSEMHTLRIELSAPGDPVAYLDNLRVWNAIPEPATLSLLVLGALGLVRRRRRRA